MYYLNFTGFKCTENWVKFFLRMYGFDRNLKSTDGPTFKDYRDWIDLVRSLIDIYQYKNLFHVDELRMFTDIKPAEVLEPTSADPLSAVKDHLDSSLNRVSLLLCCNSSGTEKLPPLICGTYEPSQVPTTDYRYIASTEATFTDHTFSRWIKKLDRRMTREKRKILLIVNRDRMHVLKKLQLKSISLIYLPKNFSSELLPLRKTVFHYIKMNFRRVYTNKILLQQSWGRNNVLEAITRSWEELPRNLIVHGFQITSFRTDMGLLELEYNDWEQVDNAGLSFEKFVTFDDNLSDYLGSRKVSCKRNDGHLYNLRSQPTGSSYEGSSEVQARSSRKRKKNDNKSVEKVQSQQQQQQQVEEICSARESLIEENVNSQLAEESEAYCSDVDMLEKIHQRENSRHEKRATAGNVEEPPPCDKVELLELNSSLMEDNGEIEGPSQAKRSKPASHWSDCFQTQFVFGPTGAGGTSTLASSSNLHGSSDQEAGPNQEQQDQVGRSGDHEKKCIYTIFKPPSAK